MYMKRNLLFIAMASIVLLMSSCSKYVIVPDTPPLAGQWYLQSAERFDSYKWQTVNTGYENGTFTFHSNGDVSYIDALGSLYGTWNMYPLTSGYYDWNGYYQENYHTVFSLRLYENNNSNPALNLLFDDNNYNGGNSFKAIYTTGNYRYEYTFIRE